MKKFIERIYDNMYIAMEERKPIKVQNSKLSTTNHIIELLVNLDQNPNTKSIASNTIIMANPALTPKEYDYFLLGTL